MDVWTLLLAWACQAVFVGGAFALERDWGRTANLYAVPFWFAMVMLTARRLQRGTYWWRFAQHLLLAAPTIVFAAFFAPWRVVAFILPIIVFGSINFDKVNRKLLGLSKAPARD